MKHSEGSRPVFSVQLTSTSAGAPQPFPSQIEILWSRETQRTEQKGSHARKQKVRSFSLPLPITPPAFLSSKSKAAFTKSLQKQPFSPASWRNVTSLVPEIFCPPEKFSPFWVTREKTHQFRSSFTRPLDCGRSGVSKQLC